MAKTTGKKPAAKAKTAKQTVKRLKSAKPKAEGSIGYRHLPAKKGFLGHTKHVRPEIISKLPSVLKISKSVAILLYDQRKLLLGITVVYGLLNLLLVQGLSTNSEVTTLKNELHGGSFGSLLSSVSIFAILVGSAGNGSSQTAGAYQIPLTLIASLAIIWTLRQVMTGNKVRVRDAYYKGMYPLIPFILVLLFMVIQALPLVVGAGVYSIILANGIAIGFLEKALCLIIFLALAVWSLYMLSASIFALYIVTLPDMTPFKALRSAKELVRFRRLMLIRKIVALPIILLILAAIIMLPIILVATVLAQWVFFVLTTLALLAIHAYIYTLYRELISEQ